MSWIGLTDQTTALFQQEGISRPSGANQKQLGPADLLPSGALMLETGLPVHGRQVDVLSYDFQTPWKRSFCMCFMPDASVSVTATQGDAVSTGQLHHGIAGDRSTLRITFQWNAPERQAWFSVRELDGGRHHIAAVANPVPLGLGDLQQLAGALGTGIQGRRAAINPDVDYLALSDQTVPVGPMPSIAPDTPVLTARGYRRIDVLQRGDLVITSHGDQVPVLANIHCAMPARGYFRPVRLRAPYFGLQQDIVVAADQRLCVYGSDVEFLFGKAGALIPARHLVDGVSAYFVGSGPIVTWHQLLLPRNETIIAAGAALQSFYIGRLRRRPDLMAQSLLAEYERSRLPEHARPVFPVLKSYEAVTLVQHRAV